MRSTISPSLRLSSLLRTTTVRLAALFSPGLGLSCLVLFAFIYWQTAIVETWRVDQQLTRDAEIMASEPPAELRRSVEQRVSASFHRVVYASLFDPQHHLVVGNLPQYPIPLPPDGEVHAIVGDGVCLGSLLGVRSLRAVARRLPDGGFLVIGRNVESVGDIRGITLRALELCVIPAMLVAALGGVVFGRRLQRRTRAITSATARIARGELRARLPLRGSGDEFDCVVDSINHMLDDVGRMFDQVKGASDLIAHDLRTPLTQIRTRLERASETAETYEELRDLVERAVERLDQSLRSMSALLRISQIETRHRQARFAEIDLQPIVASVADLFLPVAEEKGLRFISSCPDVPPVRGDRDLLMEAIANLVENAIKYTPAGGHVRLAVDQRHDGPVIAIEDDGIGIAPDDLSAIMRRHYRSDRTLTIEGYGLGLALVGTIVRLHDFSVTIRDNNPGSTFEIHCAPLATVEAISWRPDQPGPSGG